MEFIKKLKQKQENPTGAAPVTIAFLGDSVTQGCFELYQDGEKSLETEFREEAGYHSKLRQLLQLCYPAAPVNMIHAGISGDNAPSGLQRLDRDVLAFHPDLTVVCFGLNDCSLGADKVNLYQNALEGIFDKLQAAGSEVIFMTPNLMAETVSYEVAPEFREMFRAMTSHYQDFLLYMETARRVCHEKGILLCDCCRKWEILKQNGVCIERLLSNRINHPTEEMHWMFAVSLFEMIQGM